MMGERSLCIYGKVESLVEYIKRAEERKVKYIYISGEQVSYGVEFVGEIDWVSI
jgi:hypothetical protein